MVAGVVGAAQYAASGWEMIVVAVRFRIRSHFMEDIIVFGLC